MDDKSKTIDDILEIIDDIRKTSHEILKNNLCPAGKTKDLPI